MTILHDKQFIDELHYSFPRDETGVCSTEHKDCALCSGLYRALTPMETMIFFLCENRLSKPLPVQVTGKCSVRNFSTTRTHS